MDNHLDPHISTLLGMYLLGDASDEALEELRVARKSNAALNEAMELLEKVGAHSQDSPFGDNKDESMKDLTLPDFLEPERLSRAYSIDPKTARRVKISSAVLLLMGVQSLVFSKGPIGTASGVANILIVLAILAFSFLFMPAHLRGKARRIAEGGEEWSDAVAGYQRLEAFSFGPWQRSLVLLGGLLALGGLTILISSAIPTGGGMPFENPTYVGAGLLGGGLGLAAAMFGFRRAIERIRTNR